MKHEKRQKNFLIVFEKKEGKEKAPKDLWKGLKLSSFKLIHITQINKLIHANRMACVSGVSWQWLFMGISDSPTMPILPRRLDPQSVKAIDKFSAKS